MSRLKIVVVIAFLLVAVVMIPHGTGRFVAADATKLEITLYDGDSYKVSTAAATVACLLYELEMEITDDIRLSHGMETLLRSGMVITVERQINFVVMVDNVRLERAAWPNTTVKQVLMLLQQERDTALVYGGNYGRRVAADETLRLQTWRQRTHTEVIPLEYAVMENVTDYVLDGRTHLRHAGEEGLQEVTVAVVYIGGMEQNRQIMDSLVLTPSVDRIYDVGAGQLGALVDVTAPDFHYVRRVRMEATAYTAGFCCTGKRPGDRGYRITASGREVEHGIVAVDRRLIPLGTMLYVEGYGFALAADVGGAIRGYKIDLFMEELADARQFGRRHLYVWILDEI